jgi:hypothetical protein
VFFSLNRSINNSNDEIEIWATNNDIELLFMVKHIDEYARAHSSISETTYCKSALNTPF